jgi:hypothetical protein
MKASNNLGEKIFEKAKYYEGDEKYLLEFEEKVVELLCCSNSVHF